MVVLVVVQVDHLVLYCFSIYRIDLASHAYNKGEVVPLDPLATKLKWSFEFDTHIVTDPFGALPQI